MKTSVRFFTFVFTGYHGNHFSLRFFNLIKPTFSVLVHGANQSRFNYASVFIFAVAVERDCCHFYVSIFNVPFCNLTNKFSFYDSQNRLFTFVKEIENNCFYETTSETDAANFAALTGGQLGGSRSVSDVTAIN